MDACCNDHSGHVEQLKTLKEGQKTAMNTSNAAHRRIDGMKNWVIAGMTSLVMQLLIVIAGLTLYYVKSKGG